MLLADPPLPYKEISLIMGIPVGAIGPYQGALPDQGPRPSRHWPAGVPHAPAKPLHCPHDVAR
jgi:hypothetical protein